MKRILRVLSLLPLLLCSATALATHLVGGNLGYEYIGETAPGSQLYRYRVFLEFYMNCGANSNFQTLEEFLLQSPNGAVPVGIYRQDPLAPNADKIQQAVADMVLVDQELIIPEFPDNCTVGAGLCTIRGRFEAFVDLPLSFSGYHLYTHLFSRNLDIDNLFDPNATGIGYYAFVPGTLVENSSPTWFGIPTPFLCAGDTTTFVNSASDTDGDQLIFSFVTPYNSLTAFGGVQPAPGILDWPVPEVTFNPGFSSTAPLGVGGYAFLNGATGLTEYAPVVQGNYVVAVEVKEFRNGQLIGISRRDLQLQAIPCPPNNTPQPDGPLPLSYSVNAGEQLCFTMNFEDLDVDSLVVNEFGTIFDGNLFSPPATFAPNASVVGTASGLFCWNTVCDQGQEQPYLFSVSVVDNGCPPKSLDVVFQVNVIPFLGPDTIAGPVLACTGQSGNVYSVVAVDDEVFTWTVSGGAITSGQGTDSITVDWGAPGTGSVQVSATNALGCSSEPIDIGVNIAPLPAADAGSDAVVCAGTPVTIGGNPTGPSGSSVSWSPSATLSNSGSPNPIATTNATTTYIVSVSSSGCVNRDTVRVVISAPQLDAGPDVTYCAGDTAQLQATATDGTIAWTPANGLSATDVLTPLVFALNTTVYTITVTDSVGCAAQDSVLVTMNPLPDANAGNDTTACINEVITLGGAPTGPTGSTFSWTPVDGLSDPTVANPAATITVDAIWTVLVTDTNGCASSDQVIVTALEIPAVDAGADTSICAGQVAQLNGTGNGTLLWSPIFGLSDPTIGNPTANPEATTTYTLTVTGGNLCTNTDQTTVTVNVLPSANAGPDLELCAGDTIQIQASGPGQYSWTPAATLSDASASNPLAFPLTTTTYILTLADTNACVQQDSMRVIVSVPVNAGTDASTTTCGSGLPFNLFNLIGGSPQSGGTWSDPNGQPSDGTYSPGTSLPGAYNYIVDAPAPCGPDTAVVTVNEIPNADAGESAFLPLCSNSAPIDLFTVLGGTPMTGGTWTDENAQPFSGTFDPAVNTSQSFTYTVSAVSPCADDQAQVTVFVTQAPDPGGDASVSVCASGIAFVLSDSLSGSPEPGGTWTDPSGVAHLDSFDPAVDPAGDWTYTIPANAGCADTSATLTVSITVPNTAVTGDDAICVGDTTQLTNTGNVSWAWTPATDITDPTSGTPEVFPATTTTYSVFVTDANGCTGTGTFTVNVNALPVADAGANVAVCDGASATIGGSPTGPSGSTYLWSPSTGLDDPTASNPQAQPAATTTYTVVVTDGNACSASDQVEVTWNALPQVNAGLDTSVCLGGSVQLFATGSGTFSWSPAGGLSATDVNNPVASPSVATTYVVTLTDGNNCVNTDEVLVAVNGIPTVDAGPDRYLCPGFSVQLNGSGGGAPSWSPAGTLDNAAISNPSASPLTTTTYTLTITDGNGCTASDAVQVQVSTDPPVDAGADQDLCGGQSVVIGGNPTNVPGTSVLWSPADGLDDATSSNPTATPTATTSYVVTVTSDTCTSQDIVLVSLQGIAQAAFTMRLEPGCDELRAFFTDLSTGASQWSWNFGDGATSTEQNPQHYFAYGGPIVVTLTITDAFGCTGSITQTFDVNSFEEYVDYEIPNVFTPNDDGKNDVFTFNTNGILGPCVSMQVFNRWGQKVFDSLGNNIVWDGRNFAGEQCVTGTYFYTIVLKEMSFSGNVYLNR